MSPHPYFSDPEKQRFLESLARGKPGAVSMPGAGRTVERMWFPAIDGRLVANAAGGLDGHETKTDAKAAAIQFRDECRRIIAQANGEDT